MGRAVAELCRDNEDAVIAVGVDTNTVKLGDFPVYADPMEFNGYADCAVDFSHASALGSLLDFCVSKNMPMVLCTTGYNYAQNAAINIASKEIPIFQSANMSYGIHVLKDLAARAAALLGGTFDIEIIERHHNQKLDAPSGTAIAICDAVAGALPYAAEPVYDRHAARKTRDKSEIGMHAVRGGTIVGDHDLIFAGHDEVITITHSALSREIFAAGAIKAAIFMSDVKKPGLYGFEHLTKQ
jgi:4-hydroxy-tetrahydrodipicolinate reductase